ncbi:MAG TPA: hypothetical protein VG318_11020 [Actinomycetota bacterium]|nr:hypothetical protein [Actinomycetota bacterium]
MADLLLALLSLLFPSLDEDPAHPPPSGPPIVFAAIPDPSPARGPQCGNPGDPELFTIAPNGVGLRRLTQNRRHESDPSWSPGRRRIVFSASAPLRRDPTFDRDLYVMRRRGGDIRRVTRGPGQDGAAVWSPDGETIAFVRQFPDRPGVSSSNDKRALMVVGADGTGLRRLTPPRRFVGYLSPAWSPDGGRLAVTLADGRTSKLVVRDEAGDERALVADRRKELSLPDWSPDGRRLVFSSFRTVDAIERVRVDGSGRRDLTSHAFIQWARSPAWSPSGRRIAFSGIGDGCLAHVFRMTARGTRHTDLLAGRDLEVYSLDW